MNRRQLIRTMFGVGAAAVVLPSEVFPFRKFFFMPRPVRDYYKIVWPVLGEAQVYVVYPHFNLSKGTFDEVVANAEDFDLPLNYNFYDLSRGRVPVIPRAHAPGSHLQV